MNTIETDMTLKEFLDILNEFPEFDNMDELFHSRMYHPEGDGSLHAHMIAAFEKWKENPERTTVGFWALVFHDIGKQACADWKGDDKGLHSFIKHESVGADIFADKYSDLNDVVDSYSDMIEWVIRQHTNFWQIKKHGKAEAIANHSAFVLLAEVCLADKMGQTLPDGRDMDEEWAERMAFFATKKAE